MSERFLLDMVHDYCASESHAFPAVFNTIIASESPFSRDNANGHITGSAFIVDPKVGQALLIHHKGLDLWLPPGGHVDEGETPVEAARREAGEEVGLCNMTLAKESILDIDIHKIPYSARKQEPEHWHVDFSFLFFQDSMESVTVNEAECKGYRWVDLLSLAETANGSLKRMATKALAELNLHQS